MILTTLLTLGLTGTFLINMPPVVNQKNNLNDVYTSSQTEITLSKSSTKLNSDDIKNFDLNETYIIDSSYVISNKQDIVIEPVTYYAPDGWYFSIDGTLSQTKDSYFKSDTYTEPGGYVTMTTTAYQIGFYDGNIVYHITSKAILNKNFFFTKKDNLVIRYGENAAFYDGKKCEGKASIYDIKNNKHDFLYDQDLTPSFEKGSGVLYEFPVIQSTGTGDSYNPRQTIVEGDYYIVATNTTNVQSVYIHNQNLLIDSLSFSFGPVGINIPLSSFEAAIYYATPLTLPGYNDTIKKSEYTINQSDYDFEQQYFFYTKTSNHQIDNLSFTTNRLRCGYIEEEYINLSSQRKNAGTAYLEYNFDNKIYKMNSYLTFWSNRESFQSDDIAYVQYLDEQGNWVTCFDLLNNDNPLPTDRKQPKLYEFNFMEGTLGVRFYSHTNNAYSDRNKGRICIGKTIFTTYSIY